MASKDQNNTPGVNFLKGLHNEDPDNIKLLLEKNRIKKQIKLSKKRCADLEDEIRRKTGVYKAEVMKLESLSKNLQPINLKTFSDGYYYFVKVC